MFIVFPRYRTRVSVFAIPLMLLMLYTEGGEAFFVMLFAAFVHELGHLLAIAFLGYRTRRLDILPMSALIVLPDGIPYRDELIIAVSGPLASLLCAAFSGLIVAFTGNALLLFFCVMNGVLCFFNLLPFKKSDGGKALYSALATKNEKSAERVCSVASYIALFAFAALALLCVLLSDANFGFVLLTLALVLQVNT